MKYLTLLFSVLLFVLPPSHAQNDIPNNGFENWTEEEPVDWNTLDQDILGTEFNMVTQDKETPFKGSACVRIETLEKFVFATGDLIVPGFLTLGEIKADPIDREIQISGGIPYSDNPESIKGYYKYLPEEGDSTIMGLLLYKWNGETRDTIASASYIINKEVSEWTKFEASVEYDSWKVPDTMNMIFSSTAMEKNTPVGSVLFLDELTFNYGPTSIIDPGFNSDFRVYPQSYSRQFRIHLESDDMVQATIEVFNIRGQLIKSVMHNFYDQDAYISYKDLESGVYIIRVVTENDTEHTQKIEIH